VLQWDIVVNASCLDKTGFIEADFFVRRVQIDISWHVKYLVSLERSDRLRYVGSSV